MFVGQRTGQWACQACRKRIYNNINTKRLFGNTVLRWQSVEGVPPGLIVLARKMAVQYQELEKQAAATTEYTPQTVQLYKRIGQLSDVATILKELEDAQTVKPSTCIH